MQTFLAFIFSFLAATIPTIVYSAAFYWADRYEREPRSLALIALVWGAIPAIVVSFLFEISIGSQLTNGSNALSANLVELVIVAPIVEEFAKALALLGLFYLKRNEFDGVLDGLIYGALIGFGFAMTENFIYFTGAYLSEGFLALSYTVFLRTIVFGLNHAFYTSLTGIGFGMARNERDRSGRIALMSLGLLAAILVHSLHNLGIALAKVAPAALVLSIFIAGGGLAVLAASIYLSWRHEQEIIQSELAEEIGGLISPEDFLELTRNWRQPIRDRSQKSNRYALFVELAIRKRRLRIIGADKEDGLLRQVHDIRRQIETLEQA